MSYARPTAQKSGAQYATLVKEQSVLKDIALGEFDLQRKLALATQSQLMREAVDAFAPT
jgi:hypothetical protein